MRATTRRSAIHNGDTFTDFSLPGGPAGALPTSINDKGTIAGYYYDSAGAHVFVLRGMSVQTFQISGMTNVFPIGINNSEQISIQAIDSSGQLHAFLKHGKLLIELAYPNATETVAERINNAGQLVGAYYDAAGTEHGFAYDAAKVAYYTIDVPGAAATALDGINDAQTIVGSFLSKPNGRRQGLEGTGSLP